MQRDVMLMYLRNSKNVPVGSVAVVPEGDSFRVTFNFISGTDRFEKRLARVKAIGQLKGNSSSFVVENINDSLEILYKRFLDWRGSVIRSKQYAMCQDNEPKFRKSLQCFIADLEEIQVAY
jgi:hypothetical protein